jgi:hypothetical protein
MTSISYKYIKEVESLDKVASILTELNFDLLILDIQM